MQDRGHTKASLYLGLTFFTSINLQLTEVLRLVTDRCSTIRERKFLSWSTERLLCCSLSDARSHQQMAQTHNIGFTLISFCSCTGERRAQLLQRSAHVTEGVWAAVGLSQRLASIAAHAHRRWEALYKKNPNTIKNPETPGWFSLIFT